MAYYPPEWKNPIEDFFKSTELGSNNFAVTYTAGHHGEPAHEWTFSHHEIYDPRDPQLPTIVILRYRTNTADTKN